MSLCADSFSIQRRAWTQLGNGGTGERGKGEGCEWLRGAANHADGLAARVSRSPEVCRAKTRNGRPGPFNAMAMSAQILGHQRQRQQQQHATRCQARVAACAPTSQGTSYNLAGLPFVKQSRPILDSPWQYSPSLLRRVTSWRCTSAAVDPGHVSMAKQSPSQLSLLRRMQASSRAAINKSRHH